MRLEDIKDRIDVLRLLELLNIEGRITGKDFMSRCPFPEHDDSTPSFSICLDGDAKGLFHCFGCGAKGTVIHLVQRVLGMEREQAEKKIAQWFGFSESLSFPSSDEILKLLGTEEVGQQEEEMVRIPLPRIKDDYDKNIIIDYLVRKRNYTEKRAWDIINFFNIKYSDSGFYSGRLIIPIYDSRGLQVTFEARDVTGEARKKVLYPQGSPVSRLLFNNHNVMGEHVWITEGVWDAIRLWSFGEPAISVFGTHLGNHQSRIIIDKYSAVLLLFDGDEAGKKAREETVEVLSPYVNIFEYQLLWGDPADLNKEDLSEIIRQLRTRR